MSRSLGGKAWGASQPPPHTPPCCFQSAFLGWAAENRNPPKKCNPDSKSQG